MVTFKYPLKATQKSLFVFIIFYYHKNVNYY